MDLLAVQGTLKSLLQHHSSKASSLQHSAFFTVQISHPYLTTGKNITLTRVLIPHVFQKSECLLFQKDSVAHILCSIIYSISRSTSGSNYSLTLEPCAIENPHRSNNQSSVYVVPPYPSFLCIYSSTYTDSTSYDYTVLGYLLLKS